MIKKIFKRKATEELTNQSTTKKLKPTYTPSSPIKTKKTAQKIAYTVTCAFVGDKNSGKSNLLCQLGEKEEQRSSFSLPSPSTDQPIEHTDHTEVFDKHDERTLRLTRSITINNEMNVENGLFEKYHAQLRGYRDWETDRKSVV